MTKSKIIGLMIVLLPLAACTDGGVERDAGGASDASESTIRPGDPAVGDTTGDQGAIESTGTSITTAANTNNTWTNTDREGLTQGRPNSIDDTAGTSFEEPGTSGAEGEPVTSGRTTAPGAGTADTSALTSSTITRAQEALRTEGFNVETTGQMGSDTTSAIREFQSQEGLAQTGMLDAATLNALDVETERAPASTDMSQPAGSGVEAPSTESVPTE